MRRGGVWNTAEGKREPQNIWRNIKAGLGGLQPPEIPENHQSFLWKSLAKTSLDLEKLGKIQADRHYFATSAPASTGAWYGDSLRLRPLRWPCFFNRLHYIPAQPMGQIYADI
jgi:hypothetical protein